MEAAQGRSNAPNVAVPGEEPARIARPLTRRVLLLAAGLLLLAFADVIVLERIYKPTAATHGIAWREFELHFDVATWPVRMLWWHVAFLALGLGWFALLGVAARDLHLALAGCVLFATGWEDLAYYALLASAPPAALPWLDANPCIAWTKGVTPGEHVTAFGLGLAALTGGLVAGGILRWSAGRSVGDPARHGR